MWYAAALILLVIALAILAGIVLCVLVDRAHLGVDDEVHP